MNFEQHMILYHSKFSKVDWVVTFVLIILPAIFFMPWIAIHLNTAIFESLQLWTKILGKG